MCFSQVRRKDFWMLSATEKILHKFIPQLCHEADGLILQVISSRIFILLLGLEKRDMLFHVFNLLYVQ